MCVLFAIFPTGCAKSVELFEDTGLDVCDYLSYEPTQNIGL
jgi:hypothetical protein